MIRFRRHVIVGVLVLLGLSASPVGAQAPNGAWVYPSAVGNLLYQLDSRGQRINDFSQCGYRGGTEPLPNVTALIPQSRWVYVSPGTGDDTALIQAAIDSVEALPADANGWRGVVYLNAGEYQLATTLTINASGVVLKGAGDSSPTGAQNDQLTAGASVILTCLLDLVAGPNLGAGTSFRILNKTSAGAISGTFAGKAEGSAFTADGYTWIISYLGGDGNDVVITLATPAQAWRFQYFGTIANSGTSADTFDANNDGELNLLEYATGQNPNAASLVTLSVIRTSAALEITDTRSKAALDGGMLFAVEWSDNPATAWSVAGVTQLVLTDNGTLQSIKAAVPAGPAISRRFIRLKVISP